MRRARRKRKRSLTCSPVGGMAELLNERWGKVR
jgi:hypothetical protein